MRRILIEKARSKQCKKRGGEHARQELELRANRTPERSEDLLALDEALVKLEQSHPRLAELVKLRYFAGLTIKEAAQVIGVSGRTADSDWSYAEPGCSPNSQAAATEQRTPSRGTRNSWPPLRNPFAAISHYILGRNEARDPLSKETDDPRARHLRRAH